eukprot:30947-Eustigmatos_ZCMA.PRE.1
MALQASVIRPPVPLRYDRGREVYAKRHLLAVITAEERRDPLNRILVPGYQKTGGRLLPTGKVERGYYKYVCAYREAPPADPNEPHN